VKPPRKFRALWQLLWALRLAPAFVFLCVCPPHGIDAVQDAQKRRLRRLRGGLGPAGGKGEGVCMAYPHCECVTAAASASTAPRLGGPRDTHHQGAGVAGRVIRSGERAFPAPEATGETLDRRPKPAYSWRQMRIIRNSNPGREASTSDALDRFRAFLHGRSLRATDVREAIVGAALAREGHFHVEDLTEDVRKRGLDVSAATVYRALPLLVEAGIIQPTEVSGESRSYEASFGREHHDHLICRDCHRVVEFQFEAFEMLQREVALKYGFELVGHHHELIGVCSACRTARAPDA
jgi:Fur family ferric uptake transcriptional regulator